MQEPKESRIFATHGVRIHQECKVFWPFFGCADRAPGRRMLATLDTWKGALWHAYVPWNGKTCLPNIGISMMTLLAAAEGCSRISRPCSTTRWRLPGWQPWGDMSDLKCPC